MSAQESGNEADLQTLYQQIDDAIEHSPQYVAKREMQISCMCVNCSSPEKSLENKLTHAEQLFELYKPYKNDSALYLAETLVARLPIRYTVKDKVGLYLSLKAHQCSDASLYVESLNLLKRIDRTSIRPRGSTQYYAAWMHVCGELGSYSQQEELRNSYYDMQDLYRDSVLVCGRTDSEKISASEYGYPYGEKTVSGCTRRQRQVAW